ncbi:MAG: alpha/beta hydrolase-fold protein, partial [Oceanococcus sp.]
MREKTIAIVLLAGLLCACSGGKDDPNAGQQHRALSAWDTPSSGWAGTATSHGDTWVYQDYVYDDYGADTCSCGQPSIVRNAPSAGDYRYPASAAFANNAADILNVRLRPIGATDVEVQVTLNTLIDAAIPALLVLANGQEQILSAAAGNVEFDPLSNTLHFVLRDVGDQLTLFIGAGLADESGGLQAGQLGLAQLSSEAFTTGGPATSGPIGALFDVAFNTEQLEGRGGAWNENRQSAALAAGDISEFFQLIDLAALRQHRGPVYTPGPGYHVAIFKSDLQLGEGVNDSALPHYLGQHQPYSVWIPHSGQQDRLVLALHSRSEHHNQYRGGESFSFRSFYEQLGDGTQSIVVTPLARSPEGWYEREALIDTLEVWADVRQRFPSIQSDQIHLASYSMGGYGSYKLATIMPDAFASVSVMAGPPSNGVWAYPLPPNGQRADGPDNTYFQLDSLRNLPISIKHGSNDELVPITGVIHQVNRMAELGLEFRFDLYPGEGHLFFPFTDDWLLEQDWINAHPQRQTQPGRVSLKLRPAAWLAQGASSLLSDEEMLHQLQRLSQRVEAKLRGAYWLSDIQLSVGLDPGED